MAYRPIRRALRDGAMHDEGAQYDFLYNVREFLNVFSGGTWTLERQDTAVAPTLTATAAELNYLDITTLGTGAVSKAVVLDGSGDYTFPSTATIVMPSGGDFTFSSGSTLDVAGTFEIANVAMTASAAELNYNDIASLGTGAASKAIVLDANGAYVGPTASTTKFTWSVTSTSTDGGTSVEPFVHNTTMSGIGGVGGRARFELDTNVALGGWANALKAQTQFGSSGSVSGLGSAFVAELILSAGKTGGTYAPLEIELGIPSGASCGTATSFIYMSANDTPAAFDTAGFLFNLAGLTAGSGKIFNSGLSQAVTAAARLRCKVGATTYFIPLCAVEALTS